MIMIIFSRGFTKYGGQNVSFDCIWVLQTNDLGMFCDVYFSRKTNSLQCKLNIGLKTYPRENPMAGGESETQMEEGQKVMRSFFSHSYADTLVHLSDMHVYQSSNTFYTN